MNENEGKPLSIEIRVREGVNPELIDLLREGIEDLTKELLPMAGIGFELDSIYSPGDESMKDRVKELEDCGLMVVQCHPPVTSMDVDYLMKSNIEINVIIERDSA